MATDVLAGLKDIHLPPAVSIWPLAVGWYILAVVVLVVIALMIWFLAKKIKAHRHKQAIISLFDTTVQTTQSERPQALISEISTFLKRVIMQELKADNAHLYFGEDWLKFLDQQLKTDDFSKGDGRLLLDSYRLKEVSIDERQALIILTKKWLRKVL
ncbi:MULTISPECIES: DUF4381 domain-containing protein [Cysteiniphilum]|uniref:DUF4381 domain-containing protein n=1 Tax=Cysteiniphilum litorale TaxID=2056700 RepID=A0A8J3E641_9GAMM|nr:MULTISPECIES: DUF4381 domain-containing protein [Cysteiniphilum]GGF87181.1 hypothetical protein GCM10010995_00700 [Cysteiniphilum litorale]